jgi:uroporphyrin-III C-methyltransferase
MTITFVGAGPGEADLLTRDGRDRLRGADVVVYDRSSLDAIAAVAPATAERVRVGRTGDGPAWSRDRIVALLADRHGAGRAVVRLKSGDLFVCARTSEETAALTARAIPFSLVPGVSAAVAAPVAAGIALGTTFTVIAGNEDPRSPEVGWDALAAIGGTLVVLMGRAHQRRITERLIAAGMDRDTPVAVIAAGTRPDQARVTGILADLPTLRLAAPATIVIGAAASASPEPRAPSDAHS